MLRKQFIYATLLLSSSVLFAGTMGPNCVLGRVTTPCESRGWDFGAKALYLQPYYTGAQGTVSTITDVNGNFVTTGNTLGYRWGFMLEASYHFSTGSDFNLNWYHLGDRTTNASGSFPNYQTYAQGFQAGGPRLTLPTFQNSMKPQWDAVNLEFGQQLNLARLVKTRVHAGLQYAHLQRTFTSIVIDTGNSLALPFTYVETNVFKSTTNAVGPRVGLDVAYAWPSNLSIYGKIAGGVVVGSAPYRLTVTNNQVVPRTVSGSATQFEIIPEVEAKLGLSYTKSLGQGELTIDGGWMSISYINGIFNSSLNDTFGAQGPYFGFNWLGNLA